MRPKQFLGHKIIDARFLVDLRKLPVISERIWIPADLNVCTELFLEVSLADQYLPRQRLARRHVEVGLNPHPTYDLPAALFNSLFNLMEHVGILLFHPFISAGRGHRELEIGIFAHQVQNAAKSVADDLDGFRPGPQPSHVDMRIANRANRESFEPWVQHLQLGLRVPKRLVESRLIAPVQCGQLNGLDRRIELRVALAPAGLIRVNHQAGSEDFVAHQSRIGPSGRRRDDKAAAVDFRFFFFGVSSYRDQKSLARLGIFSQRDHLLLVVIAMKKHRAVGEYRDQNPARAG